MNEQWYIRKSSHNNIDKYHFDKQVYKEIGNYTIISYKAIVNPMFKFTDEITKDKSEYNDYEIKAMDTSLEALFDMLSKSPSSYKVAILPGSYSDEFPAVMLDVFVNTIQRCSRITF